jgi:hypothetical protein
VSMRRRRGDSGRARQNKSSQTLPHPGDAPLRRQRRACGGGAPMVEPLYRSCPATAHRPGSRRDVSPLCFCSVDGEAALVFVEDSRVEQIHPCGGAGSSTAHPSFGSRRIWIHGHRISGCIPGRQTSSESFCLSMVASFFCGSFQSLMAMEVWWTKGWWRLTRVFADGDRRRRTLRAKVSGTQM